uniref:Putative virion glycoprotein N-terminal domain-containing protein n=1 Tax=Aphis glycines nege-like virus 1 iso 1 TaxID=2961855 RepID=A0A976RXH5_9VIRU|nr:hypothetical protein 1 [Aphis glycines nege-like virus 1 iso 1]
MASLRIKFSLFLFLVLRLISLADTSLVLSKIGLDKFFEYSSYQRFTFLLGAHISRSVKLVDHVSYLPSSFSFDVDCMSIVRTSKYAEADCQLPPRCGMVQYVVMNVTFFGQETKLCYSFHPSSTVETISVARLAFDKISSFPVQFDYGFPDESFLEDILPVDFFEYLRIVVVDDKYRLLPSCCYDDYTVAGHKLPKSVVITEDVDSFCVVRYKYSSCDCSPLIFDSLSSLVKFFNFPIAYKYNPYNFSTHVVFRNQDPGVYDYDSEYNSGFYLYSYQPPYSFCSHVPLADMNLRLGNYSHYIYHSNHCLLQQPQHFCVKKRYIYKNPLGQFANQILSSLSSFLYKIFEFVEIELENLAQLLIKFFAIILSRFFEFFIKIFGVKLVDFLMLLIISYLYTKNLVLSFVLLVILFWFSFVFFFLSNLH